MYKIKTSLSGASYAAIPVDPSNSMNLFVNQYNKIPLNKVVYDYFNTGQVYVNFPSSSGKILGFSDTMCTIVVRYVVKPSFFNQFDDNHTFEVPSWATRFVDDQLNGWMLDIGLVFEIDSSPAANPICKHYTGYTSENNYVTSKNYLFANKPNSIRSNCSNSKVYVNKLTPHSCIYSDTKTPFVSCPFYEYDYEVVESFQIHKNTHSPQEFELRYIPCSDSFAIYHFYDITNKQINYSIFEKDTPELKDTVMLAVNEIISSYSNYEVKQIQNQGVSVSAPEKKSYILSLV